VRETYLIGDYRAGPSSRPYELVAELRDDGRGSALVLVHRVAVDRAAAPGRSISVPLAALDELVPYFERRLGLAHAPTPGDADLVARYVAGMAMVAGQERSEVSPVTGLYHGGFDRIVDWYLDAGVSHEEIGHFPRGPVFKAVGSTVRAPLGSLDALVVFLERRLHRPAGPGIEDQLFACFTALVERGELGTAPTDGSAPRENAALVARLFTEAGIPCEFSGKSTHSLLATYRESVPCHLTLRLSVDTRTVVAVATGAPPARLVALGFDECHDYPRLADDPGREYTYSARLAPTPIEPLVGALAAP